MGLFEVILNKPDPVKLYRKDKTLQLFILAYNHL